MVNTIARIVAVVLVGAAAGAVILADNKKDEPKPPVLRVMREGIVVIKDLGDFSTAVVREDDLIVDDAKNPTWIRTQCFGRANILVVCESVAHAI